MPWIGDEIESHLRLGKVALFRGDDGAAKILQEKFPESESGESQVRLTDEDESRPYSELEQVEEALDILLSQIEGRVAFTEGAFQTIGDSFQLSNVQLALTNLDGQSVALMSDEARRAAADIRKRLPEIRAWLRSGAVT